MKRKPLDTDEIIGLLLKGLAEACDEKEREQLEDWLSASPDHERIFVELQDKQHVRLLGEDQQAYQAAKAYERITAELKPVRAIVWESWMPYVAALMILSLAVGWWMLEVAPSSSRRETLIQEDILPGGNRATLTLADGRVIKLSESHSEIIINEGDIVYQDGSFVLGEKDMKDELTDMAAGNNNSYVLTTPKGGVYQFILPDGSKVWLNSDSKLSLPTNLGSSSQREVFLDGEAYFEIAKDAARPFKVKSDSQEVRVLGTSFNIHAYKGDGSIKTSLLEGSVQVYQLTSSEYTNQYKDLVILTPHQQSIVGGSERIKVQEIDPKAVVAWKNGYFDFTDLDIRQVMAQLARWYDLDIIYEGQVPDIEFFGTINKDKRLSTVLALLETNELNYTLSGKKLTISKQIKKGGNPN